MSNEVKRNTCILIGLILCFTGIFMFKIEERAKMHYELLNNLNQEENDGKEEKKDINDIGIEKTDIDYSIDNDIIEEDITNDSIFTYKKNSDWNLILINVNNVLEADREVLLENIDNVYQLDYRVLNDFNKMREAANKDNIALYVKSAYRSYETQKILYNNEIKEWMNKGYNQIDAMHYAAQVVAIPGTSEHQMGIAIDFITKNYTVLEEGFDQTDAFKWLDMNAYKYGFVLRYPKDKTEITGIKYEPWHYRYVGKEVATYLKRTGLCLEELFNEPVNK